MSQSLSTRFQIAVAGFAVASFVGLTGMAAYYAPLAYERAKTANVPHSSSDTFALVLNIFAVSLAVLAMTGRRRK